MEEKISKKKKYVLNIPLMEKGIKPDFVPSTSRYLFFYLVLQYYLKRGKPFPMRLYSKIFKIHRYMLKYWEATGMIRFGEYEGERCIYPGKGLLKYADRPFEEWKKYYEIKMSLRSTKPKKAKFPDEVII